METNKENIVISDEIRSLMYAASLCMQQVRFSDAILLYDKVLERMPEYAGAYYERGRARHQLGDARGAMEDLKHALSIDPTVIGDVSGEYKNKSD